MKNTFFGIAVFFAQIVHPMDVIPGFDNVARVQNGKVAPVVDSNECWTKVSSWEELNYCINIVLKDIVDFSENDQPSVIIALDCDGVLIAENLNDNTLNSVKLQDENIIAVMDEWYSHENFSTFIITSSLDIGYASRDAELDVAGITFKPAINTRIKGYCVGTSGVVLIDKGTVFTTCAGYLPDQMLFISKGEAIRLLIEHGFLQTPDLMVFVDNTPYNVISVAQRCLDIGHYVLPILYNAE
jgi:hypothetical protein